MKNLLISDNCTEIFGRSASSFVFSMDYFSDDFFSNGWGMSCLRFLPDTSGNLIVLYGESADFSQFIREVFK